MGLRRTQTREFLLERKIPGKGGTTLIGKNKLLKYNSVLVHLYREGGWESQKPKVILQALGAAAGFTQTGRSKIPKQSFPFSRVHLAANKNTFIRHVTKMWVVCIHAEPHPCTLSSSVTLLTDERYNIVGLFAKVSVN